MHHISIRTRDLARAASFYGSFGFLPEARFTSSNQQPGAWLMGPHGRIELIQVATDHCPPDSMADADYAGYDHIALAIDVLDDVLATLRAAGAPVPIEAVPRVMNGRAYRIAMVRDPDGLLVELVEEGPLV